MTNEFGDDDVRRFLDDLTRPPAPGRGPVPPTTRQTQAAAVPARIAVINWHDLDPDDARNQWVRLDLWVTQLRADYGLAPNVIPPLWHRHHELVWELSALHTFWLNAYSPGAGATSPLMFQRYFAETRTRLREWVSTCGTKLDTDRPTRQTAWPGQPPYLSPPEHPITDRQADFDAFVAADVAHRRAAAHAGSGVLRLLVRDRQPVAGDVDAGDGDGAS